MHMQTLAPGSAGTKVQNCVAIAALDASKVRQIHIKSELNISTFFPAEVKASLRMVQAKTARNVKEGPTEALQDLLRKHNVSVSVEPREGR